MCQSAGGLGLQDFSPHALSAEAGEQPLDDAVDGAEQDAALPIDVAAVLALKGGACDTSQTRVNNVPVLHASPTGCRVAYYKLKAAILCYWESVRVALLATRRLLMSVHDC